VPAPRDKLLTAGILANRQSVNAENHVIIMGRMADSAFDALIVTQQQM
jgi:hypothetical protein